MARKPRTRRFMFVAGMTRNLTEHGGSPDESHESVVGRPMGRLPQRTPYGGIPDESVGGRGEIPEESHEWTAGGSVHTTRKRRCNNQSTCACAELKTATRAN